MTETQITPTRDEVEKFCATLQFKLMQTMHERGFRNLATLAVTVGFTEGSRFYRVHTRSPGHNAIYCLVDKSTGDIYKPTSFTGGPAKHVRGNVRGNWWGTCCGPYGMNNRYRAV